MSTYLEAPVRTERQPLSIASTVARLALIGVALAVVAVLELGLWSVMAYAVVRAMVQKAG